MKYAFFPGCTMAYRLPFVEKSIRLVAPHFNIELVDLPFTCCPEPNSVRSFSDETWLALAARNLALAEKSKLDVLTACTGCHESFMTAKHELDTHPDRKDAVNEVLGEIGMEYTGVSAVKHMHQVLFDDIGPEAIAEKVKRPLELRVVTHSGCHMLRPEAILQIDDCEAPVKFDGLVEVLGIEPLEYMDKTMCCGTGTRRANREASFAILREKMTSMKMVNPDAAVVFCPSCFISFESGQRIVNKTFGTDFKLPVYYYTELLAVALEIPGMVPIIKAHRVKGPVTASAPGVPGEGRPVEAKN
ncbi:MAG: CoB--CoM heterodisulfide reductase subunit B [Candidatus Thorarchaeota archaeon]|nr:MAG: CoB--CoM heterodisulfide reductase subunit B [Candidatus Thorarchaeota archaeon]